MTEGEPEYLLDEDGTHWVMVTNETEMWDDYQVIEFIKGFNDWTPEIRLKFVDTVMMKPGPPEEFEYEGRWYKVEFPAKDIDGAEFFYEYEEVETDWVCPDE